MARRDTLTMELPGVPKRRGRPATGKAKTGAQRQAAYRQRQKSISVTVTEILSAVSPEVELSPAAKKLFHDLAVKHCFTAKSDEPVGAGQKTLEGGSNTPFQCQIDTSGT